MAESLVLFESVINSRWFLRTSIILFLNKIDVFKLKLPKVCSVYCAVSPVVLLSSPLLSMSSVNLIDTLSPPESEKTLFLHPCCFPLTQGRHGLPRHPFSALPPTFSSPCLRWRFSHLGPAGTILPRIHGWLRYQQGGQVHPVEVHAGKSSAVECVSAVCISLVFCPPLSDSLTFSLAPMLLFILVPCRSFVAPQLCISLTCCARDFPSVFFSRTAPFMGRCPLFRFVVIFRYFPFLQCRSLIVACSFSLTQATDTTNIRLVFAAVKETILQNALKDSGIL